MQLIKAVLYNKSVYYLSFRQPHSIWPEMLRWIGEHQRVEETEGGGVPGGEALRLHEDVRRGHGGPSQEKVPPHQLGEFLIQLF